MSGLTDTQRCADTTPHEWHSHKVEVTSTCPGVTPCGEKTHPVHEYTETVGVWCDGICDCGMFVRGIIHGPGTHK